MQTPSPRLLFSPLVLAAALLLAGCGHHDDDAAAQRTREPVPVTLVPVDRRPLPVTIDVTGSLFGDEQATLSAEVPGRITEILADVGDRLAPGQRLAQIDPTEYRLAVEERARAVGEAVSRLGLTEPPAEDFDVTSVPTVQRARYQTANAAARRERGRQLFEQSPPLMSEQEYQDLITTHQVAQGNEAVALLEAQSLVAQVALRQSELATAQQRLEDAAVKAPLRTSPGDPEPYAVVERLVSLGEYVATGQPLYRIVADHPLKYRAAVPERFLPEVRRDQRVSLLLEGRGGEVTGTITRITPAVDPVTRTFLIEATIDNSARTLRPGSFVRGRIQVGDRESVVFVPREAVVSFAGLDKVYSVADGVAVEHRVTLLAREGDLLPVDEPLDIREVVRTGVGKLAHGIPVRLGAAAAAD